MLWLWSHVLFKSSRGKKPLRSKTSIVRGVCLVHVRRARLLEQSRERDTAGKKERKERAEKEISDSRESSMDLTVSIVCLFFRFSFYQRER